MGQREVQRCSAELVAREVHAALHWRPGPGCLPHSVQGERYHCKHLFPSGEGEAAPSARVRSDRFHCGGCRRQVISGPSLHQRSEDEHPGSGDRRPGPANRHLLRRQCRGGEVRKIHVLISLLAHFSMRGLRICFRSCIDFVSWLLPAASSVQPGCRFSTYSVSEGLHVSCSRSLPSRRCKNFPLFLRACDRAAVLCSTMCYLQTFFWASLVWE